MPQLDLTDIQGNILKGYRMPVARYTFLRIEDAQRGRQFVGAVAAEVTTSEPWPADHDGNRQKPPSTVNIAFSYQGLAALNLPQQCLASFPAPFQEGMRTRAELLGDTGTSGPNQWDSLWRGETVHVWVSINATSDDNLTKRYKWLEAMAAETGGAVILGHQDANALGEGKEHFGFRDGISNPDVAGSGIATGTRRGKLTDDGKWVPMAAGEFLLGHPDEAEELPVAPRPHLLAHNGTFMVYRKLHQNVASFRRFIAAQGQKFPGGPEMLAAKMVGRWRDGTPLAVAPDKPEPQRALDNDFRYDDDPEGVRCPAGSHIRRTNPRDAQGFGGKLTNRHRMIRRGLPYGKHIAENEPADDHSEHGVIFMVLGASIERQFEFVQREWVNYGNDFKLGNDKDPLVGNHDGRGKMVIPGNAAAAKGRPPFICANLRRFVTTRGGEYFFVPSVTALRKIASGGFDQQHPVLPRSSDMSFLERLETTLAEGGSLPADDPQFMRELLGTLAVDPNGLFAVLRRLEPISLVGKFGLITRFDDVQEVLSRDQVFAVPYRKKMAALTDGANFFLGMQDSPEYQRDVSNMRIAARRDDVENRIRPFVEEAAEEIVAGAGGTLDVVHDLTRVVPARLVGDYFGTPGNDQQQLIGWASIMFHFLFIDQVGDAEIEKAALAAAEQMRGYLDGVIRSRKKKANRGQHDDVIERCLEMADAGLPGMEDTDIRNNLLGLIIGAIPTTSKASAFALDQLLDRPDALAGAQQAAANDDDALLAKYVFEALRFRPANPGVFRFTLQDYVVAKGTARATRIPQGSVLLAATQSAMWDENKLDQPDQFSHQRPDYHYMHWGYALHTCFGQYINDVQIPGILKPLLQRQNLRRAEGDDGQLKMEGPFPSNMTLVFDA